jgi:hypothetical protein
VHVVVLDRKVKRRARSLRPLRRLCPAPPCSIVPILIRAIA